MRVCVDKTCEGVLCEECKDLKPSMCGDRGLQFPKDVCNTIRFKGVDDVEFKQGYCIDLYENVHAYDADGAELPFTVEPSTLNCCEVGEHEFTYTAMGKGSKMLPSFCMSKPMLTTPDCDLDTKTVTRTITVLQADPPKILGLERAYVEPGTSFDPLYEVEAIDGNGNLIPEGATYEGRYDASTGKQNIASFESDIEQNAKSLKVALEPIQEGSGTPSPDNVRPISGRTEVVTHRTGKNLLPLQTDAIQPLFIASGTEIYVSALPSANGSSCVFNYYRSDRTRIDYWTLYQAVTGGRIGKAVTIAEDVYFVAITNATALDKQLELGSTATDYEPYQGTTYTTSLGQTVYGGTLDVVSGELTVTHSVTTMTSSLSWNTYTQGGANIHRCQMADLKVSGHTTDYFSSHFNKPSDIYAQIEAGQMRNYSFNRYNLEFLPCTKHNNGRVESVFLDEQVANGTPVQVYHYLATPQTYQLTPQQISLLVGENNVWSDGKVEVIYSKPLEGATQLDIKGVYPITYHAEDVCGNETTETRYVIVANCDDDSHEPKLCQGRLCCASLTCNYSSTVCEATACYTLVACEETEIIPSEA